MEDEKINWIIPAPMLARVIALLVFMLVAACELGGRGDSKVNFLVCLTTGTLLVSWKKD
jgi:hypothetical protein